jgi:hypothetical protein
MSSGPVCLGNCVVGRCAAAVGEKGFVDDVREAAL